MKKLYLILFTFILIGCGKKPLTPNELYEKYEKSIVLIKNSYYLKATVDNGMTFYFSVDENNSPIVHENENNAIQNSGISFGTGFFISEKGEIATNRHVIFPELEMDKLNIEINNSIRSLILSLNKEKNQKTNDMNAIMDFYAEYKSRMTPQDRMKVYDKLTEVSNELDRLELQVDKLSFNPKNTVIEVKHLSLGIAYNNTFVTEDKDFVDCVPKKKSNNKEIDLAIIQLKDKKTPEEIVSYFDINVLKDLNNETHLNDKIYMIGYNYGYYLANTKEGIRSQMTEGTITQEPDESRILYSIPTLQGSSGSPVFNEWGNLIGINYAKISETQGFSFGVPALALSHLYDDPDYLTQTSLSNNEYKTEEKNISYSDVRVSDILYGYKLGQYVETINNNFKNPTDTIFNRAGINYYGYLLEEDTSSYIYFGIKDYRIKSIQLFSLSRNINPTFRNLKMGESKNTTIKQLGNPSNVTKNEIKGELLEFSNTNFSVEINKGKLSSIRIWDDPTLYDKPQVEDLPTMENLINIIQTGNNESISKLLSPELEFSDGRKDDLIRFGYSWNKEIKYDYSGVYQYLKKLVNQYKNSDYEQSMRLSRGQLPLLVYKFHVTNKVVEIVFRVENGKYVIWEINNHNIT